MNAWATHISSLKTNTPSVQFVQNKQLFCQSPYLCTCPCPWWLRCHRHTEVAPIADHCMLESFCQIYECSACGTVLPCSDISSACLLNFLTKHFSTISLPLHLHAEICGALSIVFLMKFRFGHSEEVRKNRLSTYLLKCLHVYICRTHEAHKQYDLSVR